MTRPTFWGLRRCAAWAWRQYEALRRRERAVATTGWPEGLMQDDDRGLARWFASRADARRLAREAAQDIGETGTRKEAGCAADT